VFDRSYQFNDNLKLRQHEVSSAPCAEAYFFKMIEGKFSYCIRRNGIQWTNSYKNYANTKEVSDLLLLPRWWSRNNKV